MSGSAAFRLYESAGRAMNQNSRRFEIMTEKKGRECKVVDFSLR